MAQTITIDSEQAVDEIIKDKTALSMKHQVMGKLKWNALLSSVAESCKFVAGPLFAIGVSAMLTPATAVLAAPLLIAAVSFLLIGVGSGYAGTRIWQSGQFDNFEINAASTARHLVQELKTSRMVIATEHTQNSRSDGRSWSQVVRPEQALPTRTQTT